MDWGKYARRRICWGHVKSDIRLRNPCLTALELKFLRDVVSSLGNRFDTYAIQALAGYNCCGKFAHNLLWRQERGEGRAKVFVGRSCTPYPFTRRKYGKQQGDGWFNALKRLSILSDDICFPHWTSRWIEWTRWLYDRCVKRIRVWPHSVHVHNTIKKS